MQLPFFYEPTLIETNSLFTLSEETNKHAIQVLRLKLNDALHLTNGKGLLCRAVLSSADKKQSIVTIQSVQFFEENPIKLSLGISLLKNKGYLVLYFTQERGKSYMEPFLKYLFNVVNLFYFLLFIYIYK